MLSLHKIYQHDMLTENLLKCAAICGFCLSSGSSGHIICERGGPHCVQFVSREERQRLRCTTGSGWPSFPLWLAAGSLNSARVDHQTKSSSTRYLEYTQPVAYFNQQHFCKDPRWRWCGHNTKSNWILFLHHVSSISTSPSHASTKNCH